MATVMILVIALAVINIIGCIYDFFMGFYFMATLHLFAFSLCIFTIINNSKWI